MDEHDNIFDDCKKRRKLLASCCPNLATIIIFNQKRSDLKFAIP